MEKKRVVPIWLSVVLLILCAVSVVLNIVGMTKQYGIMFNIGYIAEIITLLFVSFYCLSGYKKKSAGMFKGSLVFRLISVALGLCIAIQFKQIFTIIVSIIVLACLTMLLFIKDLGKRKSMVLTGLMIVATVASLVYFCAAAEGFIGAHITSILLSVIFFIMVYAKYKDKEARGTK